MRLPNKLYTYKESLLARFTLVLSLLEDSPMGTADLLEAVKGRPAQGIKDASELLDVLDCLYALRKIDFDEGRSVLYYVG